MTTFDSHPKSKFWSNRDIQKPNEVALNSHKKFWFDCGECGHPFESSLLNINKGNNWCGYCSNPPKKLCDCSNCYNKSFASVERSKHLNDKTIKPRMLFKNTNKKFKFDCDICNKVFSCQLSDITKGVWCSNCVNKTEKILFDKLVEKYDSLKRQYKVDWCKNIKHLPFDFVIEERKLLLNLMVNNISNKLEIGNLLKRIEK